MSPIKSSIRALRAPVSQLLVPSNRAITSTSIIQRPVSLDIPPPSKTAYFLPQNAKSPTISSSLLHNPFNSLIQDLTASLTSTRRPELRRLTFLLRSYDSTTSPEQWRRYAFANAAKQYTRNLVCEVPGLFNLLMLVWTPGMQSPVHDHADAHCLMKVLQGSLRERRWAIPESGHNGEMALTSDKVFRAGGVTYMSDEMGVHEIGNPSAKEFAVSLHLYTPPNAAIRGCRVYDIENGVSEHVMQGLYDSVGGLSLGTAGA